ncbi:YicC/YloC family endoribonuclease [Pararhodobacter sp. SW119]|uniref:YicC/YloC family endoribonuclease n=1 Tax=Pararhodobacter sp. SW119 TaxID=2780075 RepID=UPI001FD73F61|nr:YicC/YloC family endoribonuclease [Pararhodobacter sp. SW119]
MTGFATETGSFEITSDRYEFSWELRAVNARGLDLRFRLPDGLDGLEAALRRRLSDSVARGSVTLSLRLIRGGGSRGPRLDPAALEAAITLVTAAEAQASERGLLLAPMTAAGLLGLRGVLDTSSDATDPAPLVAALLARLDPLIASFEASRADEGTALRDVLQAQVDAIERLTMEARRMAENRRGNQAEALRAALLRLGEAAPGVEPGRLEQELALIAVRGDLTEELDRLAAHCAAARAHLESAAPVGRKLDFLMQEFNREANTLCSKSQHAPLTRIGLDVKAVIDQMREQVQNVE